MQKLFVPYKQGKPALVAVNGHHLVVLSHTVEAFDNSELLDVDTVKELDFSIENMEEALAGLSEETSAGVVVTPDNFSADELIDTLEEQLPWVQ